MVDFRDKKRVETREASIKVDPGLPVGRYVFQLTAFDTVGNQSKPARISIEVVERPVIPVAPVRIID